MNNIKLLDVLQVVQGFLKVEYLLVVLSLILSAKHIVMNVFREMDKRYLLSRNFTVVPSPAKVYASNR